MESGKQQRNRQREKRQFRIRKRLRGTAEKPRLCVIRSNQHIYVQLIDDEISQTIVSASTLDKQVRDTELGGKDKASARELGLKIAQLAKGKNIKKTVLDRGSRKYHGAIAALADGAREGGLEF